MKQKGMKQKGLMKKLNAVLLATAMTVSTFPQLSTPVFAADTANELPTVEQFATVDELKKFNTDDTSPGEDKNPARVYFGNKDQQWWIAGSQNGNVTLFAASPLATGQQFEPNWIDDKSYDDSWGCTYPNDEPSHVYPNHYGASEIRNTTLKGLETNTDYFSTFEQALMSDTEVTTDDTKNGDSYKTTDKLYLAYGEVLSQYITVGSGLNDGLHVDKDYWGSQGDYFWLRAPYSFNSYDALAVLPGPHVGGNLVGINYALVPAFGLNLSNVSFASAAPAASSDGDLDVQDVVGKDVDDNGKVTLHGAFTLRYRADNLGSVLVSYDKSKVTLAGAKAGIYLVVQNHNGAWAKQVTDQTTSVSACDMNLDSFANCKVWLETTDTTNRITYATLATEEQGTAVNITADTGLTITSNNGVQAVAPNTEITDITVAVADGYYLQDNYENSIQGLNGLRVTNVTKNGFTISGTPTSDVRIILPAATPKAEQTAPNVTGGIGSTINGTTTAMEYAAFENSTTWTTCTEGSTEVGAGTWYVRFKETDTQKASPATEVIVTAPTYTISVDNNFLTFDTKNEGYETDGLSQSVQITNTGNSRVTLVNPTSTSYDVSLSATELDLNETATLTVSPKDDLTVGTYNETIEVTTTENTLVSIGVSFTVNGAFNVSLNASGTSIIEGQSVILTATAQGGSGNYTYKWYKNDVEDTTLQGNEVTVSPTETTTYKVTITDTIEDKSATATITVTAKKFDLEVPTNFNFDTQHEGYKDVSANSFSIKNTGNVDVTNINAALTGANADAFTLDTTGMQTSLAPNGTTSFTVVPKNDLGVGTYTAQVQITGETGVSKSFEVSFTVEGHEYDSVVTPATCTSQGYTTHTCKICKYFYTDSETDMLPHEYKEEWTSNETGHWHECKNCDAKSEEAAHTFKEVIDKEPTETEKGSKHEECTVCGYKKANVEIPVVTPSNPDTEKPNTEKPGYNQPSTEKPNTDKPSAEKPNTDKPGTDQPSADKPNNDNSSVKTGDGTNILLWGALSLGSGTILLYCLYRKKRKLNH